MLNVSGETVCRLVELAQAFQSQEAITLPNDGSNPIDEPSDAPAPAAGWTIRPGGVPHHRGGSGAGSADRGGGADVAGPGRFPGGRLAGALRLARDEWTPETADYLLGHPLLSEYLVEGLAAFGLSCDL
ncbi:DUF3775 domain-containing protein [Alcanivorax sp. IO_7]|nr:DUF3775 domain-containing protein [Alcanivorax sp. IO_7]